MEPDVDVSSLRKPDPEDIIQLVHALRTMRQPLPLREDQIRRLVEYCQIRPVNRGEVVIRQGEAPDSWYFILSGQLRAVDAGPPGPRLLAYYAAHTFAGEGAVLTGQPQAATLDAVSDAVLAAWDSSTFAWLLARDARVRPYFERLGGSLHQRAGQPFPGRQWDEAVIAKTGKHPLLLLPTLVPPTFLLLLSVGLLMVVLGQAGSRPASVLSALAGLPGLFAAGWLIYNFIDWRDDEYIVTSKRVIHVERYPLYGMEWDEAPLVRIQDITLRAHSWLQRQLNYHDVIIKTAGAGNIVFAGACSARQVYESIIDEQTKAKQRQEAADRARVRQKLAESIGALVGSRPPESEVPQSNPPAGNPTPAQTRRLPPLLNYLVPRMRLVEGETITWRKHWMVLLRKVGPALIAVLALLVAALLALLQVPPGDQLRKTIASDGWVLPALAGLGLVVAAVCYVYQYDGWHKDVYIVTRDRIIDVHSSAFRLRGESSRVATFDVIQNITYSIPSFGHRMLNLGSVVIETAGTHQTFTFDAVFNPSGIQQEIFNRWAAYQERRQQQQREGEAQRLAAWFGEFYRMQQGARAGAQPEPQPPGQAAPGLAA